VQSYDVCCAIREATWKEMRSNALCRNENKYC